jgi:hypothetical protein
MMYLRLGVIILLVFAVSVPHGVDAVYNEVGLDTYADQIEELDKKATKRIPIPVLFGVSRDTIVSDFGASRGGGTRTHEGQDLVAPKGTPIISPTKAVVIDVGDGPDSGKYVSTANPGGEVFGYIHLDKVFVQEGDELTVGDLIGYVGNTGNAMAAPSHLHFEIRKDGVPTDPYPRIRRELKLEKKITYLEEILENLKKKEQTKLVRTLVKEHAGVFYQAQAEEIEIPTAIVKALKKNIATTTRDLDIGAKGDDVLRLQSILIAEKLLDVDAPTGYFGPMTKEALKAYQKKHGISPARGVYDAQTRKLVEKREV